MIISLLIVPILCLAANHPAQALVTESLLGSTQWKLKLDIGLQPGTWMPKRYPGWAESGARLGLDVEIEFSEFESRESEELVGPPATTFRLDVLSPTATFVSERGEETVSFTKGGWCIQRPTGDIRNANGSTVRPEGLLRFWLDCSSGAKRRDVEVPPGTRIFFTTGVWDNPGDVFRQQKEYERVVVELDELVDKTKSIKEKADEQGVLEKLWSFRGLVDDSRTFDLLQDKKNRLLRELPPPRSPEASNGVQIAPSGSLVIKGKQDFLNSEYLILGTFSTTPKKREW